MKSLTKKSTYNLVVQSEDKNGSAIEAIVYGLLILSAVFGMWQFAAQTMNASHVAQNAPAALVTQG